MTRLGGKRNQREWRILLFDAITTCAVYWYHTAGHVRSTLMARLWLEFESCLARTVLHVSRSISLMSGRRKEVLYQLRLTLSNVPSEVHSAFVHIASLEDRSLNRQLIRALQEWLVDNYPHLFKDGCSVFNASEHIDKEG